MVIKTGTNKVEVVKWIKLVNDCREEWSHYHINGEEDSLLRKKTVFVKLELVEEKKK